MRIKSSTSLVSSCVIIAVAALINGCGGDRPSGDLDFVHSSALIAAPECGETVAAGATEVAVVLPECLEWSYEDDLLSLTHLNALYNCCLDSIRIDMVVGEQTINIVETEHLEGGQGCRCVCQYDLEYQLSVASTVIYILRLRSDNQYGVQELFEMSLDLAGAPSGTFCLEK